MRAGNRLGRQHMSIGKLFVEKFRDRERIPYARAHVAEARNQHGRGQQQQFGPIGRVVGDLLLGDIEPGQLAQ